MDFTSSLLIAKDIILIGASLTTIFFAFFGYNKWKKELRGRAKFELCRNTLKQLYALRDSFKSLRSSFVFAGELPPDSYSNKANEAETLRHVFSNRLKHFNKDYNSLVSLLPEVELEFDPEIRKQFQELTYEITRFHFSLNELVQLTGNTNNEEHYQKLRREVYDIGDDNSTTKRFDTLIEIIEERIKKELKKC